MSTKLRAYTDREDFAHDFPEKFTQQKKEERHAKIIYWTWAIVAIVLGISAYTGDLQNMIWNAVEQFAEFVESRK